MVSVGVAALASVGCGTAPDASTDIQETSAASSNGAASLADGEDKKDLLNPKPDNRPSKPMVYPDVYYQPAVKTGPGSCGYTAISNVLLLWLPRDHMHFKGYPPQWIMEQTGYRASTGMVSWDATDFLNDKPRPNEIKAGKWNYMTGAVPWNNTGWERILDDLREGRPWVVSVNACKWGNWSATRSQLLEDECLASKFWKVPMGHWVVMAGARESGNVGREILVMENGNYTWLPYQQFDLRMDVSAVRYATFYPTAGRAATHLVVPENAYASGGTNGESCVAFREANPGNLCGGPCDCAGTDRDVLAKLCESDAECNGAHGTDISLGTNSTGITNL